jgi:hypothetical protein
MAEDGGWKRNHSLKLSLKGSIMTIESASQLNMHDKFAPHSDFEQTLVSQNALFQVTGAHLPEGYASIKVTVDSTKPMLIVEPGVRVNSHIQLSNTSHTWNLTSYRANNPVPVVPPNVMISPLDSPYVPPRAIARYDLTAQINLESVDDTKLVLRQYSNTRTGVVGLLIRATLEDTPPSSSA